MQRNRALLIVTGLLITTMANAKIAHCPNPAAIVYKPQLTRYIGKQDGISWMGSGAKFHGKIIFKYTLSDTTDGVDNNQVTCSYVDSTDPYNRYFVISPADQQNVKIKWSPDQSSGSHWRNENASAIGTNAKINSTICYSDNPQDCPYNVAAIASTDANPTTSTKTPTTTSANETTASDGAIVSATKNADVIDLSTDANAGH